ncbi:MAG: CBS domain-containing protein, partial [Actinomycetota bacterium]|nr:CBS domain-containing protein [Actinomycetota bacterium]
MLARLTDAPDASLPVIDSAGHYRGVLTPRHVEDAARDNTLDTTAGQPATTSPALSDAQTLAEALDLLECADEDGLPVISPDGTRLVGWFTHRDVLRAYRHKLRDTAPGPPEPARHWRFPRRHPRPERLRPARR